MMWKRLVKIWRRTRGEVGMSLIEIVLILTILAIALAPLTRLSVTNLIFSGRYAVMTKAVYYTQERMEEIIADYAAESAGRGYDWVISNWSDKTDTPGSGFIRGVTISAENTLNDVTYVVVQVSVSGTDIPDVALETWLVDNN